MMAVRDGAIDFGKASLAPGSGRHEGSSNLARRQMLGALGVSALARLIPAAWIDHLVSDGADRSSLPATGVVVTGAGVATLGCVAALFLRGFRPAFIWNADPTGGKGRAGEEVWVPNNRFMEARLIGDQRGDSLRFMASSAFPDLYRPEAEDNGLGAALPHVMGLYYDHAARVMGLLEAAGALEFRPACPEAFHDFLGTNPPASRTVVATRRGRPSSISASLSGWLAQAGLPSAQSGSSPSGWPAPTNRQRTNLSIVQKPIPHDFTALLNGFLTDADFGARVANTALTADAAAALRSLWGEFGPLIFGFLIGEKLALSSRS